MLRCLPKGLYAERENSIYVGGVFQRNCFGLHIEDARLSLCISLRERETFICDADREEITGAALHLKKRIRI